MTPVNACYSHFELNERALCHRDGFIFEVTIDEVLVCDEALAAQPGTTKRFYLIHYEGWDEGWDEWVPAYGDRLWKWNDENVAAADAFNRGLVRLNGSTRHDKP